MLYDEQIVNSIKECLTRKKQTLAVAESVTSGHVQAALSFATNASNFFQGGITAYNIGIKCRLLDIEPVYALENDCVSEKITAGMALAVNKLFLSDYGIGITGYATTVPEKGITELFAFYAIALQNNIVIADKITSSKSNSIDVQLDYTAQVISAINELLKREH